MCFLFIFLVNFIEKSWLTSCGSIQLSKSKVDFPMLVNVNGCLNSRSFVFTIYWMGNASRFWIFTFSPGCYTTVLLLKVFLFIGEFDVNRLYKEMCSGVIFHILIFVWRISLIRYLLLSHSSCWHTDPSSDALL